MKTVMFYYPRSTDLRNLESAKRLIESQHINVTCFYDTAPYSATRFGISTKNKGFTLAVRTLFSKAEPKYLTATESALWLIENNVLGKGKRLERAFWWPIAGGKYKIKKSN